ncbi:MAG: HK97 gp10 family phage protein [Methyloceanibacter sp.]
MTAVTVKGLEALQRRLAAASAPEAVKATLREEAEAIAAEARARAPGKLANTIEIVDESRGLKPAYAVGTSDPAGRFIEFGTARRPATPWLWPAFRARSPGVKHRLAPAQAVAA